MIWKIMKKFAVINPKQRLRLMTQIKDLIILHITNFPNSLIVLLFI